MVETRLSGKESTCQEGNMGSIHGMGRCSGEGNGNPTPVFLPEKCLGQRRLEGYSPWDWRDRHHLVTKQQRVETMLRYTGKHIYGICVFFFTFVNNKKKETIIQNEAQSHKGGGQNFLAFPKLFLTVAFWELKVQCSKTISLIKGRFISLLHISWW